MDIAWSSGFPTGWERCDTTDPTTFDFPAQADYHVNPEMAESALTSDVRNAESVNNSSAGTDSAPLPRFAYTEIFESGESFQGYSSGHGRFLPKSKNDTIDEGHYLFEVLKDRPLHKLTVSIKSALLQIRIGEALQTQPHLISELELSTLLRSYETLKAYYDTLRHNVPTSDISTKEIDLFVNHFLSDRDIFQSFGFEALYECGHLSASHWQAMQHWSIDRDIDELEASILDLDDYQDCGTDVPYDVIHWSDEGEAGCRPPDAPCAANESSYWPSPFQDENNLNNRLDHPMFYCPPFIELSFTPCFELTKSLDVAAANNDIEEASWQINRGAEVNGYGSICPLATAARYGHLAVALLLRKRGARIGGTCGSQNPLQVAAANGHLEIVEYLCEQGADTNGCVHYPEGNPLAAALSWGNGKIAAFLIQHGASCNQLQKSRADARREARLRSSGFFFRFCHTDFYENCSERPGYILIEENSRLLGSRLLRSEDILIEENSRLLGYRRLRQAFLTEYSVFLSCYKADSASREFEALGRKLHNHRETWKVGMATLRQLLDGSPPESLDQVLSFLLVVSAMRSFLHEEDDKLGSKDEFCDDLDRWRAALLLNEQLTLYDEMVLKIWGKECNSHIAGHSSSSILEHLMYFQHLVTSLISHTATPNLEGDFLFTGERLRIIQSKHQHHKHVGEGLTQAEEAESEEPGISILPTQEDHRYKEIHGEVPGMAQPPQPASACVVFLMAGAIFGMVITFLTIFYVSIHDPTVRRGQQTITYLIGSFIQQPRQETTINGLAKICSDTLNALRNGQIVSGSMLAMVMIEDIKTLGCSEMEKQALQDSILYETRRYGTWLATRALCESCNYLSSYLGLVDQPVSTAACLQHWNGDIPTRAIPEQDNRNQSPNSYNARTDAFSTYDPSPEQLMSATGSHRDKYEEPPPTISPSSASSTSRHSGSRYKCPNGYECEICHKRFPTISNRNRHTKLVHRGEDRYPCAKCGRFLKTKWYLEKHQRNHCSQRYQVLSP